MCSYTTRWVIVKTVLSGEISTFLPQTQGESVRLHTGLAQMGLTSSPATCPAQMVPLHVPLDHAYMTPSTLLPRPITCSIGTALPQMCAKMYPQAKLLTTVVTNQFWPSTAYAFLNTRPRGGTAGLSGKASSHVSLSHACSTMLLALKKSLIISASSLCQNSPTTGRIASCSANSSSTPPGLMASSRKFS